MNYNDLEILFKCILQNTIEKERTEHLCIFVFMSHVGIRLLELTCLNISDVTKDNNDRSEINIGKGSNSRVIFITGLAQKCMTEWLKFRNSEVGDEPLFVNKKNQRLSPSEIRSIIRKYLKRAQLKDVSPREIRRICSEHLIKEGYPLDVIASILGHKRISTMKMYLLK